MLNTNQRQRVAALAVLAATGLATSAGAGISPSLELVISTADGVPGVAGMPIWRVGTSSFGSSGVPIDDNGNVLFRGQLAGDGIVTGTPSAGNPPNNEYGLWYGAPSALNLVARSADAAPAGAPAGWVINNGLGNGLTASHGGNLAPNGTMTMSAFMNGAGATSTNHTAFWTGPYNGLNRVASRSDAAPGTIGAIFNTNMTDMAPNRPINNAGQSVFSGSLTGGDTVAGQNSGGIWIASNSGDVSMIMRTGDAAPGSVGGSVFNNTNNPSLNGSGEVAFDTFLRQGVGTVDALNDGVLATNVGGSLSVIAQEAQPVPVGSMPGVTFASLPNAVGSPRSPITLAGLNNSGRTLYSASLSGAVTPGVDDTAIFTHAGGNTQTLIRRGDAAPVSGATYSAISGNANNSIRLNNNDNVLVSASLVQSGGITAANDAALWISQVGGSSTVLMQEGDDVGAALGDAGLSGVLFGSALNILFNNADQAVFTTVLTGTGVTAANDRALFAWDPTDGLMLVAREGQEIFGINVTSFGTFNTASGEGGSQGLSDTGWLAFTIGGTTASGGNASAVIRTNIPAPGAAVLLGLGGLAISRRRR